MWPGIRRSSWSTLELRGFEGFFVAGWCGGAGCWRFGVLMLDDFLHDFLNTFLGSYQS